MEEAARREGVSKRAVMNWIARSKAGSGATKAQQFFADQVAEARALAKADRRDARTIARYGGEVGMELTPELAAAICDAVGTGKSPEVAAESCGVSRVQLREWMSRGQAGDPRFVAFLTAVSRARADMIGDLEAEALRGAMQGKEYRGAQWMLERMHPERWAPKRQLRLLLQQELEGLLREVRGHMSESAYDELVEALVEVQGVSV